MPKATVASGLGGVGTALGRGDLIAVVDVLRFSSTVTTAVANGFSILPSSRPDEARKRSERTGIPCSGRTGEARYSLSPLDYVNPDSPGELILTSPNGAACTELITTDGTGFIACFLNARTAARILRSLSTASGRNITLVAADETWIGGYDGRGERRFALEDYLGCGCILSELRMDLSAEALLCERAFEASKIDYARLIKESLSGRELIERGHEADLSHCLQRSIYEILPEVEGDRIVRHREWA